MECNTFYHRLQDSVRNRKSIFVLQLPTRDTIKKIMNKNKNLAIEISKTCMNFEITESQRSGSDLFFVR